MRPQTVITLLCTLGMLACSTTQGTHVKKSRYSRNHIHSEEIKVSMGATAYDLIRNSRSYWLRGRGINSPSVPVVYVNGVREGDLYVLSSIGTAHVEKIQFFNSAEAFIRFGPDCPAGVISVTIN
ncbi:MAG: hypothetical protein ACE5IR_15540 [bacterium]